MQTVDIPSTSCHRQRIVNALQARRAAVRMSYGTLATKADLTATEVYAVLSGQAVSPPFSTLLALANALDYQLLTTTISQVA